MTEPTNDIEALARQLWIVAHRGNPALWDNPPTSHWEVVMHKERAKCRAQAGTILTALRNQEHLKDD